MICDREVIAEIQDFLIRREHAMTTGVVVRDRRHLERGFNVVVANTRSNRREARRLI